MRYLGIPLMLLGVYLLGQNIIFATGYISLWWRDASAAFAVIALSAGVLTTLYATDRQVKRAGLVIIAMGIVGVFMTGNIFLRPTSLIQFLAGICALASGYQLFSTGRVSL